MKGRVHLLKSFILLSAGGPAVWLWGAALTDRLGANPAEALLRGLGEWALIMLCLTLAITPLRQWTGRAEWALLRRGLGLWTFAYAMQHLVVYAWFDMGWDLPMIKADIVQRPFILVGMLAFLLLIPMALTSFGAAIKAMGAHRWKRLHLSVHVVGLLALLHFFWMRSGKNDYGDVWLFTAVLSVLWLWRGWSAWRRHRAP